jgi:ABC-type molybdate transport system permease subunit
VRREGALTLEQVRQWEARSDAPALVIVISVLVAFALSWVLAGKNDTLDESKSAIFSLLLFLMAVVSGIGYLVGLVPGVYPVAYAVLFVLAMFACVLNGL